MIPDTLKKGDEIAVIAPSNYVKEDDIEFLKASEKIFENLRNKSKLWKKYIFKYFRIWGHCRRENRGFA